MIFFLTLLRGRKVVLYTTSTFLLYIIANCVIEVRNRKHKCFLCDIFMNLIGQYELLLLNIYIWNAFITEK